TRLPGGCAVRDPAPRDPRRAAGPPATARPAARAVSPSRPHGGARVSSQPVVGSLPHVHLVDAAAVVPGAEVRGDAELLDAAFDDREVAPGSLFFCVPGDRSDGHAHAGAAVEAGAAALVVDRWLDDV